MCDNQSIIQINTSLMKRFQDRFPRGSKNCAPERPRATQRRFDLVFPTVRALAPLVPCSSRQSRPFFPVTKKCFPSSSTVNQHCTTPPPGQNHACCQGSTPRGVCLGVSLEQALSTSLKESLSTGAQYNEDFRSFVFGAPSLGYTRSVGSNIGPVTAGTLIPVLPGDLHKPCISISWNAMMFWTVDHRLLYSLTLELLRHGLYQYPPVGVQMPPRWVLLGTSSVQRVMSRYVGPSGITHCPCQSEWPDENKHASPYQMRRSLSMSFKGLYEYPFPFVARSAHCIARRGGSTMS